MGGSEFIESLDSLWFFSNVFSPRTQQLGLSSDAYAVQEKPSKPMSEVEGNQQNESPGTQNSGRRCSICGEFGAELEPQVLHLQPVGMEVPVGLTEPEEKRKSTRKSRRRRRRSKRSLPERRQILGELDLGFDRNMDSDHESSSWLFEETRNGYQMFGSRVHYNMNMKMPPLNDGMAMKEHLKSWAYAVACTVR